MPSPALHELPRADRPGWPWNETSPSVPEAAPGGSPWPRISVVMPSFNQAQFAEAAVRSVLLQAYPELEFRVVDGGSTDGTLDIFRKYERWITSWVSRPDSGQSEAVNQGWSQTTGDIIGWLNTDDLFLPGALQRVAAEFQADPKAIAVVGTGLLVNEHGRVISLLRSRPLDLASALLSGNFHQPCVFLRRSAVQEVGLLDQRLHLVMDWEYWIRLLLRYEPEAIRYTDTPLAAARRWSGAKSQRGRMAAIAEERRLVLNELFQSSALPSHLHPLYSRAIATTYWRQGHLQREAYRPIEALRSLRQAHNLEPQQFPWSLSWAIQFWLHTYIRYPLWMIPVWATRRAQRELGRQLSDDRPLRVLVFGGTYVYTLLHPDKEKKFCLELKARGFEVRRLLLDTHPPHYPPSVLNQMSEVHTSSIRALEAALWHLPWADIVVVPNHRGSQQIIEWARRLGKRTVQHDDHGGTDNRFLGADWVGVKGPWFHEQVLRTNPEVDGRIVTVGSIEFDDLHDPETQAWTRERFCHHYGLDPAKRIAVWLPSAISRHDDWSRAKYREICGIICASPNHNLIIKGHATDYARYYGSAPESFDGQHTWDKLFPNAPVCQPEHTTICFANCDVGLTINSSVGLEFPLFGKPVVYVDAFNSPRVKLRAENAPFSQYPIQDWASWPVPWAPALVGLSITTNELPEVLAKQLYDWATPEDYAAVVSRYYFASDGRSYRRLADLVSRAAKDVEPIHRSQATFTRRWLALLAQVWPPVLKRRWLGPGRAPV